MKTDRLDCLLKRIPALGECRPDIQQTYDVIHRAFSTQRKLLICGNGGSAADAEHWAGEMLKGFVHKRPLPEKQKQLLSPELANHLQWGLPVIPLTGFLSLATAFANDVKPELVFAQLVWGLAQKGDALVGISTSGNSRNVCYAAEAARARGVTVIGMTGQSGGALKALSDICICVPASETYLVQEYHLPIYHCLCMMLEDAAADAIYGL